MVCLTPITCGVWIKFANVPRVLFSTREQAIEFIDYNWALFVVPQPEPLS